MSAKLHAFFAYHLLGNSVRAYALSLLLFGLILAGVLFLRRFLIDRLKRLAARTETDFDDFLVGLLEKISLPEFTLLALVLSTQSLKLSAPVRKVLGVALVLALSWRAAVMLQSALAYATRRACERAGITDGNATSAAKNINLLLTGVVWTGAALFVLDNLGINITAAVAGLGIGGVAVALAAQQILGDLFSSFVIFIDKPFKVGDFITVGDFSGTVDLVGIKTTRVRSISGEMLVFSNSDLTGSRIRNYEEMRERRVVLIFNVALNTPLDRAREVKAIAREIVSSVDKVRFGRSHLKGFGPAGIEFELVYHVLSGDFDLYMDVHEKILHGLLSRLSEECIALPPPAQTLFLAKGSDDHSGAHGRVLPQAYS